MSEDQEFPLETFDRAAKRILQSGPSPSVTSDKPAERSDIAPRTLWKTREWLQQQLTEHKGTLNAAECAQESLSDDVGKSEIRAKDLKDELMEAEVNLSLRTLILQRLQLSDTLMKSLYPEAEAAAPRMQTRSSEENVPRNKVQKLLAKQSELGSAILRIHEQNKELTTVLEENRKKNCEFLQRNRALMWDLEQAKINNKARQGDRSSSEVQNAMWTHEKNLAKIELVRHSLQALVLASGVHWAEDENLTELMISLGTPVDQLFE